METYILDANLFFNMEADLGMGETTQAVVTHLTDMIKKIKKIKKADFLMPPRVIEEFLSFFEDKNQPFIKEFLSVITSKSPDANAVSFAGPIFYQLIEDIRARSYRGLRIGEEEIEKAGKELMDKGQLATKEFQITVGAITKKFRQRYRNATRAGFLDSLADLDLIVLAKEQNGFIISADEGVIRWGRIFGVKETPTGVWRQQLVDLLHSE